MTAISFPDKPGLKGGSPALLDWGGALTPALGGPTQTLLRLGTRFTADYQVPKMWAQPWGRLWVSRLLQAKLAGGMLPIFQDGFDVGAPGAPVVDGASQSGSSIALRGLTPHYASREGQFFNLIHGDRRYLHMVTGQVIADSAGKVTLPILPMLRIIPGDGDACDFARPMLQGSISGNQAKWTVNIEQTVDIGTITLTEDE